MNYNLIDALIEKLKGWGLFLILTLVPVCFKAGQDIRPYQEKVFVLAAVSYASLYFGSIWLTLFMLLNMSTFMWNGGNIGSSQVFNVFLGCLLFALSRAYFTKFRSINIIKNALLTLLIINLFYMILQLNAIDPIFIGTNSAGEAQYGQSFNSASGLFNYKAAAGMFFVLCLPFLFTLGVITPLLMILPIFLERSAVCYVAAAFSLIYGFFYIRMVTFKHKIIYYILLGALAIGGAIGVLHDYKDDKLTGGSRFETWHLILKQSSLMPLFGYGPDSFRNITPHKKFLFYSDEQYNPIYMDYAGEEVVARYYSADEGKRIERFRGKVPAQFNKWEEAHNEYLQVFFEYGIAGLVLIGFFFFEVWKRFRLSMDQAEVRVLFCCLASFAIFSTIQFPFHLTRIALFFPVILGAFFAYTDKDWDTFVKGA